MNWMKTPWPRLLGYAVVAVAMFAAVEPLMQKLRAQQDVPGPSAEPPPVGSEPTAAAPVASAPTAPDPSKNDLNMWDLYWQGGIFMHPIFALSVLALTMAIERAIALRRSRMLPSGLVTAIGQLGTQSSGFDPRKAYRICQQYPSTASTIIRAMLLKVGRPLSEVEAAVKEVSEREAERLYFNIRWLNLAASVAPLLGLIGTIQGMILAFHQLAGLREDQNQITVLAEGIYVALVTTFAGLAVAIPAALASHYLEGRIISIFHDINEMAMNLLPQVERYEGRLRFNRQAADADGLDREQPAGSVPAGTGN
jgi:biopolymer transport protein ExbB